MGWECESVCLDRNLCVCVKKSVFVRGETCVCVRESERLSILRQWERGVRERMFEDCSSRKQPLI